jgi:hypothetical protein
VEALVATRRRQQLLSLVAVEVAALRALRLSLLRLIWLQRKPIRLDRLAQRVLPLEMAVKAAIQHSAQAQSKLLHMAAAADVAGKLVLILPEVAARGYLGLVEMERIMLAQTLRRARQAQMVAPPPAQARLASRSQILAALGAQGAALHLFLLAARRFPALVAGNLARQRQLPLLTFLQAVAQAVSRACLFLMALLAAQILAL